MPEDARDRVAALAALLRECRDVYFAMFRNGLTTVQKPSQASFDFASTQSGPAGPWPADFVQAPRDLAVKLVRQQADFCVALGALVEAREVFDPFSTVLRTSFEYATRALWVLDPTIEHRVRCIRATLMEIVSFDQLALSRHGMGDSNEHRVARRARRRKLLARVRGLYAGVIVADDPLESTIEGVGYDTWNSIAGLWVTITGAPIPGASLYNTLAIGGHPQGFAATTGLSFTGRDDDGARSITIDDLTNRVQLAVVAFYWSLTMIGNYHCHDLQSPIIDQWEHSIESVLPAAFTTATEAMGQ